MAKTIFKNEYPMTLLRVFVDGKASMYSAPSRKGTPRGETIGFSEVKYLATLFGLIKMPLKNVAKALEISHAMLRKWRTEDAFLDLIDQHVREFASLFMENIRIRIKRREKLQDDFEAQSLADIASQDLPSLDYSEVSDAQHYSDIVFSYIVLSLIPEPEDDYLMCTEIYAMFCALTFLRGIKSHVDPEVQEMENKFRKQMLTELAERNIELLQKPTLTEADRKSVIISLRSIARNG